MTLAHAKLLNLVGSNISQQKRIEISREALGLLCNAKQTNKTPTLLP